MTQEELFRLRQNGNDVQRILDAEGTMAEQTAAAVGAAESANEAAQQVNDALQEIIETGDIPAATVAKVAEHTVQIGNLEALIFDISANNLTEGQPTPYANLAAALGEGGVNVPESMRKGGMSVKFIQGTVQSSDNNYVQYRLMSDSFNTTPSDWQGVDDEPTADSENLITSGAVYVVKEKVDDNDLILNGGERIIPKSESVVTQAQTLKMLETPIPSGTTVNLHCTTWATITFWDGITYADTIVLSRESGGFYGTIKLTRKTTGIYVTQDGRTIDISYELQEIVTGATESIEENTQSIGTLNNLSTTNKTSLVNAVNEVNEKIEDAKTKQKSSRLFYRTQFENNQAGDFAFSYASGWSLSNGYATNNNNYGSKKNLVLQKDYAISRQAYEFIFSIGSGGIAHFGTTWIYSGASSSNLWSDISVDSVNKTVTIGNVVETFTDNIEPTHKYKIIIKRYDMMIKFQLYDINTSTFLCDGENGYASAGYMLAGAMCYSENATMCLYNFSTFACDLNAANCELFMLGDSITMGVGATAMNKCFAGILRTHYENGKALISGAGGGNYLSAKNRIENEASFIKPKYIMITIGTNEGATKEQYLDILSDVYDLGAIPILNHIPTKDAGTSDRTSILNATLQQNAIIDEVISETISNGKEIYCCRFDECLCVNKDTTQGYDTANFYDSLHPNDKGYQLMYEQILIDCPLVV